MQATAQSPAETDQLVYIRILENKILQVEEKKSLLQLPTLAATWSKKKRPPTLSSAGSDPASQSSSSSAQTSHLYLISGSFEDITRFSGTTVDWLIKIAHLLCDPLGSGHLFTHTTGTALEWYHSPRNDSWHEVFHGNQLQPGIYEFEPTQPIILSMVCPRSTQSETEPEKKTTSSTFHSHLRARDAGCVVVGCADPVVASHLIPRCIGSAGAKGVVERFAGVTEAQGIEAYDPRIGVTLSSGLDHWVGLFEAGFYHITNNTYTMHSFVVNQPDLPVHGISLIPIDIENNPNYTRLHGHSVTLSIKATNQFLPPPGVFNWHYLQCVIKHFGTPEYRNLPGIDFSGKPFKAASNGESSGNSSNDDYDDTDLPYPSYSFDRYLQQQSERLWALERHAEIVEWASGLPNDIC